MEFTIRKLMKNYKLAKSYYDHYGNLDIQLSFKTKNGYEYDEDGYNLGEWVKTQKSAIYLNKGKLSDYQIYLLNKIDIVWFSERINRKLQNEEINSNNLRKKKIEILNRFKIYIGKINNQTLPFKEEINENFIKELNCY